MKKVMILAVMMVASLTASALWSVTPKVGFNLANITNADDASMRFGLVAGADLTYRVSQPFAISVGAFYSMQGAKENVKIDGVKVEEKANLDYINLPILANVYVVPGLAIKAGVQPGFNVLKKVALDGTMYQASVQGGASRKVDESYKINEGVKGFALAIPVGISYEYESFVLDARYNIGVTKAFKGADSRHSVFSFTLGYKFAL